MKLTIEKPALAAALTKVTAIVERRNAIPIIGNVVLTADEGKLTVKGTDLDIEVTDTVFANVDASGVTTVNADTLAGIVKKAPNGALISLKMEKTDLVVSFGRSVFKLSTLPADDFPAMASGDYESTFEISASNLGRMFGKTAFAMSTEETRYYLNGVYLHSKDGNILAVSTDGHKLAKITVEQDSAFPGVIVPRKAVVEVRKALSDDPITVSVSPTKIRFASGATVIVSKVIDGTFPDYARVIPTAHPHEFTVKAQSMRDAADRVAMVAEDKSRAVALEIGNDVITLQSRGTNSEATDEVDAEVSGEKVRIGFSSRYLAEALAQCDTGNVVVQYKDRSSPCVILPEDDAGFMAVVMPMRV